MQLAELDGTFDLEHYFGSCYVNELQELVSLTVFYINMTRV